MKGKTNISAYVAEFSLKSLHFCAQFNFFAEHFVAQHISQ